MPSPGHDSSWDSQAGYGSSSGRRQYPAASSTGGSRPPLPPASLQDAFATRDDAIWGQEEVAALLLQQTQDLHATEQHLAAYHVELGRLHAEMSDLRGQVDLTGVNSARIQGLQDQTDHQLGEIQDLERRLTRMTRERDRFQASNDHLAAEMDLAGAEILDLQTEYADIERDLEDSEEQRRILESNLDRVQAALQRAEEERPRASDPVDPPASSFKNGTEPSPPRLKRRRAPHSPVSDLRRSARNSLDPHNLPDPMTSAASKRPREDSNTPDPNSAPPAKRRFTSQDPADAKDDHSLSDPANRGGEIDDDGGRISEDHEEGGDSVSDETTTSGGAGSSAEGEDTETAEVADELFEAQTLEALSQSRSAERRRQHASPPRRSSMGGSGGPPGGSDDSDSEKDPDPQGHGRDPATPPRPRSPMAPADPLLLATSPGWIFPHLDPENRPQYISTNYCSDLVTEVNVRALLDTRPWDTLEGTDNMIAIEADVGGRPGLLIQAYRDFETSALMSYCESTHSVPIPDSAVRRDPWLGVYHKERNNRRSHAGRRWKAILELLIIAMREGWCDLDILLDPFFLHFPKRVETVTWCPGVDSRQVNLSDPNLHRPEPTDLLEALDECNAEDP
ncbi:unnamed protein product [Phytophthora fragariaefolia]|uniref:Unnamed protein product n=1 Tax=Phytophthora fragariaefolia TaxID=1490495 RepID=A0A9W6XX92_9STRA|nr:unnamed protein product [Phytophthora fragariaefolia]